MKTIVKWIVIIGIIVFVGVEIKNYLYPERIDVSDWAKLELSEIESRLGFRLKDNPKMVQLIYEYTDGEVTVSGDSEKGIGVVYIDGKQSGLHIDNRKYGMFGLRMGLGEMEVEDNITYDYDDYYEVVNDISEGGSTATFYENHTNGDCLIVVFNDLTHRIVALTYYTEGEKVTELLSPL